jgi:hypothetical protein
MQPAAFWGFAAGSSAAACSQHCRTCLTPHALHSPACLTPHALHSPASTHAPHPPVLFHTHIATCAGAARHGPVRWCRRPRLPGPCQPAARWHARPQRVGGSCCSAHLWRSARTTHCPRLGSLEPGLRAPTQLLSCCPGVPACLAVFASTLPPLLPCCPAACSAFPSAACRVQTRTDWACDYEADMAQTFKANNQHSHVRGGGAALSWQLGGCCYHLLERRASSARCIVVCAPQHLPIHSPV